MQVTIARRGKSKVLVTGPGYSDTINPESRKHRLQAAELLGVEESWLQETLTSYGESHDPKTYDYEKPDAPVETLCVTVRGMRETGGVPHVGPPESVFRSILVPGDIPDLVAEWDGTGVACILDVDYHGGTVAPSKPRLEFLGARLEPRPLCSWVSKGGGLHALYVTRDGVPADVLAAVGSVCWGSFDPTATFDLVPRTRLPGGDVHWSTGTSSLEPLRKFLGGGVSQDAITEYLDAQSLTKGTSYDHSRCPINPVPSHGKPVYVGDGGLVCLTCQAGGRTLGSRQPGFIPYTYLCGSPLHSDVYSCVKNHTHWCQAEVVLDARCQLRGRTARLAYQGMLMLMHGTGDPRVSSAMFAGDNIIRGNGRWVTRERYETLIDLKPSLQRLPACRTEDDKPKIETVDMMTQGINLSRYGYASIQPVYGCRIFGQYLGTDHGPVTLVMPPRDLMNPGQESLWPRYVEAEERMDLEAAWSLVEATFPGINREYLMLLIAARGVAEGEVGLSPFILAAGPSSTGKSQTVQVAASMCGDSCTEIQWNVNPERFRQSYMEGADSGTFVITDELIKSAVEKRVSPREAFDVFLTLTSGSRSHKLYVGPVSMGRIPVTVVTDTYVPPDVRNDVQLGRRFVYVDLKKSGRIDWVQSLINTGVRKADRFRASSPQRAEASNAIVSHVIDTYFRDSVMPLSDIAETLGFSTLEQSDEMEPSTVLPEFFHAVCQAPEIREGTKEHQRWPGCGWKVIRFDDTTDLAESWRGVCDGLESMARFSVSRKATECDWATVVSGLPRGTALDVQSHGRTIAVRFRAGSARGCGAQYNQDLLEKS